MDKEFSEGFMSDMADLIEVCLENRTDSICLDFDFGGKRLYIDMTFGFRGWEDSNG